jgi:hypothetical protein
MQTNAEAPASIWVVEEHSFELACRDYHLSASPQVQLLGFEKPLLPYEVTSYSKFHVSCLLPSLYVVVATWRDFGYSHSNLRHSGYLKPIK